MNKRMRLSLLALTVAALCGCASLGDIGHWEGDLSPVGLTQTSDPSPERVVPTVAGLTDLLALALTHRAELDVAEAEVAAAWGRARQAGLWPNPEFEFEAEGLAGNGPGDDEFTYSIVQPLALSGRLRAAREAGLREHRAQMWTLAGLHREVAAGVGEAHAEHLGALAALAVAREQISTAQRFHDLSQARRETGRGTELDTVRSSLALAEAVMDLRVAERSVETTRVALAGVVGLRVEELPEIAGDLAPPPPLPTDLQLINRITESHPLLERRRAEIEHAEWALREARRARFPDVNVGVGVRDAWSDDVDDTVVLSASVPLPLFDRNQGAIDEAVANLRAAEGRLVEESQSLWREMNAALARCDEARLRLEELDSALIPAAQRAEALALEGYRIGAFTQLEEVEARQTLNALQGRRIETLVELLTTHRAVATTLGLDPDNPVIPEEME